MFVYGMMAQLFLYYQFLLIMTKITASIHGASGRSVPYCVIIISKTCLRTI